MSEFKVTIKGKEYKRGFLTLVMLQKAMAINGKMSAIEKQLGLVPPLAKENMTEAEALEFQKTADAYAMSSTPEDLELWKKYKSLWLSYVGCYLDNALPEDFEKTTLPDEDLRGLVAFFGSVTAGTIQKLKNMNGTSQDTVKPDSPASH